MKKWLIGLTGSMASGKSTALRSLATWGVYTISADELVRELYTTDSVRQQLEKWFHTIEPSKIAQVVFSSHDKRKQLEEFLHPLVWKLATQKLAAAPVSWAVFEVPLLFEARWNERVDLTVLITASQRTMKARLKARRIAPQEYEVRRQVQLSEAEKISRADIVVYNEGTVTDLERKMKRLQTALSTLYA